MKELFLIAALSLPASGAAWFGSERGALGPDPQVRIYKMLLQHMTLNIDGKKRALVVGNSPRTVHELNWMGIEAYGLAGNAIAKGYVKGIETCMPFRHGSMAMVILAKSEPDDPWLAMKAFQSMIGLIKPWGFFVVPEQNDRYQHWLPKYHFSLLPFYLENVGRIWQRTPGNGNGSGTHKDVYYRHFEVST